jgi:hypothetical protein
MRFGQAVAPQLLAAAQQRKPLLLLVLGAPLQDRLADETDVDRDDAADRRIRAPELFDDQAVRNVVDPHPAVGLWEGSAEETDLR